MKLPDIIKLTGSSYLFLRDIIFFLTQKNPEIAHRLLISYAKLVSRLSLQRLTADPDTETISVSNAAGFNKNGDIPGYFLWACGFDRNVVGTVTLFPRKGNPLPRCFRVEKKQSFINYMGLPNNGAHAIAENLKQSADLSVLPITLNIAHVSQTHDSPRDTANALIQIIRCFDDIQNIDRLELNISCPNVDSHLSNGTSFFEETKIGIDAVNSVRKNNRKLFLKVSPDMSIQDYDTLIDFYNNRHINGFTLCNTSTNKMLLTPEYAQYKGGISGHALYETSLKTRQYFLAQGVPCDAIIACGGLSNREKIDTEMKDGIQEFQVYTPLIYQGLDIVKILKKSSKK